MKVVEMDRERRSLEEVIDLAKKELVVIRQANGALFALSLVDEFAVENELLKTNPEFLEFLEKRSEEKTTISLEELRERLSL